MTLRGPASIICPGVTFTDELIQHMVGKPVTAHGIEIGILTKIDLDNDMIFLEIDDQYSKDFLVDKVTSFEMVGGTK